VTLPVLSELGREHRAGFLRDVETIFAASVARPGHFAIAELDSEGVVVIRDEAGNPTAWMSPEAFDACELAGVEIRNREQIERLVADMKKLTAPRSPLNRHERRAEAAQKRRDKR
jgi:hypothetical protein